MGNSGREEARRRIWEAPESGICGEDRASSNVGGVGGLAWVEKCRGIASASLGPPLPVGSAGCPASSPMGVMRALGGPGTGSRHRPVGDFCMQGMLRRVGGGFLHAGHAGGYRYGGPTSIPNPIPSLTMARDPIHTPYSQAPGQGHVEWGWKKRWVRPTGTGEEQREEGRRHLRRRRRRRHRRRRRCLLRRRQQRR